MAVSKGKASTDGAAIKRYIGVAPCTVLAINPDAKKAEELLGYEAPIAPYVNEIEVEGKKIKNVRLDFIVRTDEKCGVSYTGKLTFFLQKAYHQGSSSGKFEIVDKYGRFAWATKEDITNKAIPVYNCKDGSTMKANISDGYRPAYISEAELTDFIKKYLVIPNVQKWDAKAKKFAGLIDNPSDAECRLDKIDDYFNGKFDELNKLLTYQPDNKIKLLFGVRSYEKDGQMRTVQVIYNRMTLPNRTTDYSKLTAEIQNRKDNGGLSDTEYLVNGKIVDIREYNVEATNFNAAPSPTDEDPFGDTPTVSTGDSDLPWDN